MLTRNQKRIHEENPTTGHIAVKQWKRRKDGAQCIRVTGQSSSSFTLVVRPRTFAIIGELSHRLPNGCVKKYSLGSKRIIFLKITGQKKACEFSRGIGGYHHLKITYPTFSLLGSSGLLRNRPNRWWRSTFPSTPANVYFWYAVWRAQIHCRKKKRWRKELLTRAFTAHLRPLVLLTFIPF